MPKLSIVIAVVHGPYDAAPIRDRCVGYDVQIVLVAANREMIRDTTGGVDYAVAGANASEREMRQLGVQHATGERIAILGDRYEPGEAWVRTAISVERQAIAGNVLPPPTLSRSGWAIYLAEYSYSSGPVEGNIVYRPEGGSPPDPAFCPELSVLFSRPPDWRLYLRERYRDSREWASELSSGKSRAWRFGNAVSRTILPALLIYRRFHGRYPRRVAAALPYLIVSGCVEATAEIVGFLSGGK